MASSVTGNYLPRGCAVFTTFPDILFIPELIIGGLVWILIASTRVAFAMPQGWVMFVSVFCFVFTTVWLLIFLFGCNKGSVWPAMDTGYNATAALFYLSAAVIEAYVTLAISGGDLYTYRLNISAVVMAFVATLLYVIHTILSALRWKSL
ncbi:myelin and lymphocyte protein-like [Engraulis encrasicolus]|uniref:myelin and lymphocyte protein-like n=1 Tax=Engraulis encrasicolus TaxID=184585 RepID=UPI002FD67F7F